MDRDTQPLEPRLEFPKLGLPEVAEGRRKILATEQIFPQGGLIGYLREQAKHAAGEELRDLYNDAASRLELTVYLTQYPPLKKIQKKDGERLHDNVLTFGLSKQGYGDESYIQTLEKVLHALVDQTGAHTFHAVEPGNPIERFRMERYNRSQTEQLEKENAAIDMLNVILDDTNVQAMIHAGAWFARLSLGALVKGLEKQHGETSKARAASEGPGLATTRLTTDQATQEVHAARVMSEAPGVVTKRFS